MDGVLLDTEGIYTEFWSRIDRAFPTGVERFAHVIKGSNLESILNTYFAREKHAEIVAMLNDFQRDMDREIKNFADAVEGKVPCMAPAEDGVTLMKILDAVYLSAATGKSVDID